MSKKAKHLLVIRLSAMGDVAMAASVIKNFVVQNPDVKITLLSKGFLKPIFENIPNVAFYTADTTNKHKGILGLYKLYKELKALKIDAVADLHNVMRSKVLRFFFSSKPAAYIDKGRAEKKALTRIENRVFKQLKTSHERYADVFRKLGFNISLEKPVFLEKQQLTTNNKKLLGTIDVNTKLIGIAPFAQYDSKTYPLELIEKCIEILTKKTNYKVLLFGGGKKEIDLLSSLENKFPNTASIAGKIKLREELIIISNLDCMISMDSGNGHFSALFGVPTITIWGTTHPFAGFTPFHQPKENSLLPDLEKYPNIPCSIYGNKICDGYEKAMETIQPTTVTERVFTILEK